MTDYRKILMLRSMGYSQREMERSGVASRMTVRAICNAANCLGISWPLDDDITNADLERLFCTRLMKPCLHLLSPKCENSTMEKMYF